MEKQKSVWEWKKREWEGEKITEQIPVWRAHTLPPPLPPFLSSPLLSLPHSSILAIVNLIVNKKNSLDKIKKHVRQNKGEK